MDPILRIIFRKFAVFALLMPLIPLGSCDSTPPEYREFLRLSPAERIERMQSLTIDRQIDYYLAGTTYAHPPMTELGDVIAEQGKEAVPHLVNRLRQESSESRQLDLMYVFRHMNRWNYDLRDEKEALGLLREVTANMKDHRDVAERVLRDILESRPVNLQRLKEEHPDYFPPANIKKPR